LLVEIDYERSFVYAAEAEEQKSINTVVLSNSAEKAVNRSRERRGESSVLYLGRVAAEDEQSCVYVAEVGTDQASVDAVEPSWSNECSEPY